MSEEHRFDTQAHASTKPHFCLPADHWLRESASPWSNATLDRLAELAHTWTQQDSIRVYDSPDRLMPTYPDPVEPLCDQAEQRAFSLIDLSIRRSARVIRQLGGREPIHVGSLRHQVAELLSCLLANWDETLLVSRAFLQTQPQENWVAKEAVLNCVVSCAIGAEAGYSFQETRDIGLCALIHEFGLSSIEQHALDYERILNPESYLAIRKHLISSLEMTRSIKGLPDEFRAVSMQVHERPNGQGYPYGLSEQDIHPWAKLIAVSNTFVAMASARAYRPPLMPFRVIESVIALNKERRLDRRFVSALIRSFALYPIGSLIKLPDNRTARIVRRIYNRPSAPVVQPIGNRSAAHICLNAEATVQPIASEVESPGTDLSREMAFQRIR